jgi:hypothetical protein
MSDLIERLQTLTGPSREIDAEIEALFFGGRASHTFTDDNSACRLRRSYGAGSVFQHEDPWFNGGNILSQHHRKSAEVTGSIDAAVAMAKRVLPGWSVTIDISDAPSATLWTPEKTAAEEHYQVPAPTAAIAICIAVLAVLPTPSPDLNCGGSK